MKLTISTPSGRTANPEFIKLFDLIMTGNTNEASVNLASIHPFTEPLNDVDWEMWVVHCLSITMILTRTTLGYCINYNSSPQYHFGDLSLKNTISSDTMASHTAIVLSYL